MLSTAVLNKIPEFINLLNHQHTINYDNWKETDGVLVE